MSQWICQYKKDKSQK